MTESFFTLKAATFMDIPFMAKIGGDGFKLDRNTQVKAMGKEGYDLEEKTNSDDSDARKSIISPRCRVIKAVHKEYGELLGSCIWGFRGFDPEEVPPRPGNITKEQLIDSEDLAKDLPDVEWLDERTETKEKESDDPTKRLDDLSGDDLARWMRKVMPSGTKCMFVVGISVAQDWQGKGIGSALLRWGTDHADKNGVFCWVHSSESAWPAYAKSGFDVVETLDVDLDEYAIGPPPQKELEGAPGKWGHYIFRYMKRLPR